jgi:hypothetical protein
MNTADRPPVSGEPSTDLYEWTKNAMLDAGFGISMTPLGRDRKVEALSRTIAEARQSASGKPSTHRLDALWADMLFDACASDGPIRDADVREAMKRGRPKIEAEARATPPSLDVERLLREAFPVKRFGDGEPVSGYPDWDKRMVTLREVIDALTSKEER